MKTPKVQHQPHTGKVPTFNQSLATAKKEPAVAANPDIFWRQRPSWRLSKAQMVHPFGWHDIDAKTAAYIREKLAHFESRTWAEILVTGKKQNHQIAFNTLSNQAQKRLTQLRLLYDEVVSLRLSAKERVVGVLEDYGVLHILFWDPAHQVCPSIKD